MDASLGYGHTRTWIQTRAPPHTSAVTLEWNLSLRLISSFHEVILLRSGQCPAQITISKHLNSTDGMASRHLIVKFIFNNSTGTGKNGTVRCGRTYDNELLGQRATQLPFR